MATPQLPPSRGLGGVTISAQKTLSRLLQLPTDIFILIIDELPLHARYFLSQTCWPIRKIVHQDWAKILQGNFVSHTERMEFYTGLAYSLPDKFACLRCRRLHNVDVRDTPSSGYSLPQGECPHPNFNRYDRWINYSLGHNHVQLALKYTRLSGPYADYLAQLMAPFALNTSNGSLAPNVESCRKVPGIRAGRFILQTIIEYSEALANTTGPASGTTRTRNLAVWMLCRHTSVQTLLERVCFERDKDADKFDKSIESLAAGKADTRWSCWRCRTDMLAQFRHGVWTFQSWQDFGSETEAGIGQSDILFTQTRWGWWGLRDVVHLQQPQIPHIRGSIEELWRSETPASSSTDAMSSVSSTKNLAGTGQLSMGSGRKLSVTWR